MNAPRPLAPAASGEIADTLRELRPYFVRCTWFTVIASVLTLVSSWYMLEVYDRVVNSRNAFTLLMLTLVVLAAFALMQVLEWAHSEEMREAGNAFDGKIRDRVFNAAFEANLRKLPGGTPQPLIDLRTLREFLGSGLVRSVMEVPVALIFLLVLYAIQPMLALVGLLGAAAQALIAWMNERSTQPPLSAANRHALAAQQYADGTIRNAQVIEAMGMLRDIHSRWFSKQSEFLKLQVVASDRAGVYTALSKFLQTTLSSALLGLGAYLLLNQQMTGGGGMIIIASIIGGRVLQPLVGVVTQWRSGINARDAHSRLASLLTAVPAKPNAMSLPAPRGRFTAENLIVAAPNTQTPILKGVSFALNPGEVLAVIGPSACGKTSLARAMMGLWPSVGGKARLDGADIHAWGKEELGPHVGYLPQGVELFDGTIAENIARFGDIDMIKVEAAARIVGVHDLIDSLPEGYETDVGSDGARLSGGQRQRIGLARALYGDPRFIVLDEPNSSLDEAGEAALLAAIRDAKARGTTVVVITHRINLVTAADKVLLMRDGAVQLFGPRDEVTAALAKANQEAAARAQRIAAQPTHAGRAAPEIAS